MEELKKLEWEHEVLKQRFEQTQNERDELYGKFVKAIHEVQQKSNFKNLLLEKKLGALADTLEKKVNRLFLFCDVTSGAQPRGRAVGNQSCESINEESANL